MLSLGARPFHFSSAYFIANNALGPFVPFWTKTERARSPCGSYVVALEEARRRTFFTVVGYQAHPRGVGMPLAVRAFAIPASEETPDA